MKTEPRVFLFLFFLFFSLVSGSVPRQEITALFDSGEYEKLVERALRLQAGPAAALSPGDRAFLNHHLGLAYQALGKREMAWQYFKANADSFAELQESLPSLLALAELHLQEPLIREAYLERIVGGFPGTPEAGRAAAELVAYHLRQGNLSKALEIIQAPARQWPHSEMTPQLHMLAAMAYAESRDFIEAHDFLRLAERAMPESIRKNAQYLFYAGKIKYNNQDFKTAAEYLQVLQNVFPVHENFFEAALILADSLERENKTKLAAAFLIQALDRNPPQSFLYPNMLRLGRMIDRFNQADYQEFAARYPLFADTRRLFEIVARNSPVYEQRREATILLTLNLKRNNFIKEAIKVYRDFMKNRPDPMLEKYFRETVDLFLNTLAAEGEWAQILRFWLETKETKSIFSSANLNALGDALVKTNMWKNALEVFNFMLRYNLYAEHWDNARRQKARISFNLGLFEDCLADLEKTGPLSDYEQSEFQYYRVVCLQRTGRPEEAEKTIMGLDLSEPGNPFQARLLIMKAEKLMSRGERDRALETAQILLAEKNLEDAVLARALSLAAEVHFLRREWPESIKILDELEKRELNLDWVLYRRASVQQRSGLSSEARATAARLAELFPDSFWLKQWRSDER